MNCNLMFCKNLPGSQMAGTASTDGGSPQLTVGAQSA